MIGKINIRISAANPQMPLGPFHVFAGSAASFTICDIPLPLGVRKVEGVSVQVKNADGETRGLAAVRVGSAWGVTVPAGFFSRSGSVEKGIVITAAGHDDNGEDVSSWKLGAGDVFIMSDNGTVAPGEVRQDLEWFDEVPDNPRNGYVAPVEGVVCVYRNGVWVPLGSQGDVRRADFQDIQELTPGDSSGVIKERFNQMLRTIKGTVAAVAAVVGFAVWAELGPDTIMDDVSGTNTVREVVQAGSEARMLPKYLRALRFADSYPDAAAWYYSRYARAGGACSSVRDGNTLSRNYDWDFDAAPSWVIEMESGPDRFGSVGVASVGTNLAAGVAVSGSPFFKALPGMTLDGVNENGVAANINVVSSFGHTNGWHGSGLHCLGAIRWVLDHATNAQHAAEYLAANVYVPQVMLEAGYSYHYMIADAAETWIVEDGQARMVGTVANRSVMTNFRNFDPQADPYGTGRERYTLLENGGNITSAWFTLAYVAPGRESEFRAPGVDAAAACARAVASWATKPKEQHRGETFEDGAHWWQSVHTAIYDLANRILRVSVQETDDWYVFKVPAAGGGKVKSVNGKIGEVVLSAADVHALPDTYTPPAAPVQSVNGKTGAVQLDAADVGAIANGVTTNGTITLLVPAGIAGDHKMEINHTNIKRSGVGFGFPFDWIYHGSISLADYLQNFIRDEEDPTVPSWAKSANKPTYTADDVGAVPKTGNPTYQYIGSVYTLPNGKGLYSDASLYGNTVFVNGWANLKAKYREDGIDYLESLPYYLGQRYVPTSRKINGQPLTSDITIQAGVTSVNSKTGAVTLDAGDVGAASAADVQTLNIGYTRLYNFNTGATNANFTATNYPPTKAEADARCHWQPEPGMDFSTVPASLQLNEKRDGEWRTVVDTRDWTVWYYKFKEVQLTNELARLRAENEVLSNKVESAKAWGGRTANGIENPLDDTVVVDRPNMWLMADYEWQKCVSGSNQCFVLRAKNVALSGGANTNGFLEVCDAFGKPYMRINKSSETFADPVFSEIRFDDDDGAWYVVYSNSAKPTKGGANVVIQGNGSGKCILYGEDEEDCPAVITWPNVPESRAGHWIMKAVPKPVNGVIPDKLFFGAEIRIPGSDYVEYLKEASFGAGIRFGANVYDPVESGDQLIWRKRQ